MKLYLLSNALLFIASPLVSVWRLSCSARLWLARATLLCCIAGPLALHQVPALPLTSSATVRSVDAFKDALALLPPSVNANLASAPSAPGRAVNVLLLVLIGATFVGALRLGRDAFRLRQIHRHAVVLRRRGRVRVLVSGDVDVPFSFRGLRRRYIVLPVSMLERPFDLRLAVSHEAQHHRQWDCLLAHPQELLRLVFMLNPMIHLWLRRIGELQELACDEALVRSRYSPKEYGACLVRVAQSVVQPGMACAVGMATIPFIQRRVVMLMKHQSAPRKKWLSLSAYLGALVPTLALAYTVGSELPSPKLDFSHVDERIQRIAEEEARTALETHQATSAAIVVVEPSTGDILAFAEAGTTGWETRAVPAGSVVKPFLYDAALKAGLVKADTVLETQGPITIDGQTFNDHEPTKTLTARDALARSSNIGAFRVSQQLGLSTIRGALEAYGLREETQGTPEGDQVRLARLSAGESVRATIASLAGAYGKLARSGDEQLRSMLTHAVTNGTGLRAKPQGVAVAGKTGTVQLDQPSGKGQSTVFASFAGFAPADAPRYVIYTIVENPSGSAKSGGAVAAPVFEKVALRSLSGR